MIAGKIFDCSRFIRMDEKNINVAVRADILMYLENQYYGYEVILFIIQFNNKRCVHG